MPRRTDRAWDTHAIKAEISRRGFNQAQLALHLGFKPSRFRHVWNRVDRPVERKICDWINEEIQVSIEKLWPNRYPITTTRGYDSKRNGPPRSQNSLAQSDVERAA